jgi:polar amino acid transport system substrate-binding protein
VAWMDQGMNCFLPCWTLCLSLLAVAFSQTAHAADNEFGLSTTANYADRIVPATIDHEAPPQTVRFCYQDEALYPYFTGSGVEIPNERPGATIEHLQYLFARVPQVSLSMQRLPWQRCLKYLADGKVDVVVANYNLMRRSIGVYPPVPKGAAADAAPDVKFALTRQDICLATVQRLAMRWNGKNFSGMNKVMVAHPQSKMALPPSEQMKMVPYPLQDYSLAPELLIEGRIDAMAINCKIRNLDSIPNELKHPEFVVLQPAIYQHRGYLLFSQQFYQEHAQLADLLWQSQQQLETSARDKAALDKIYRHYLNGQLAQQLNRGH